MPVQLLSVRDFSPIFSNSAVCQGVDVYIQTGFRDTPPQKVWPYIWPLMHVTWSNSLELNGVKEKYLSETLEMLLEESQLRILVHNRQIDFLTSKR